MPKIYNSDRLFKTNISTLASEGGGLDSPDRKATLNKKQGSGLNSKNIDFLKKLGYKVRKNGHFKYFPTAGRR